MRKTHRMIRLIAATVALLFVLAPMMAAQAAPAVSLSQGDESYNVTLLQEQLVKKGYLFIPSTGYYGDMTKEAVRNFQKQNNLATDGVAGPVTLEALFGKKQFDSIFSQPMPTPNLPAGVSVNATDAYWVNARKAYPGALLLGQSSKEISDLQTRLTKLGYYKYDVTGYFGQVTLQAVRTFQANNGSTVDGIVGPATLKKINATNAICANGKTLSGTSPAGSSSSSSSSAAAPRSVAVATDTAASAGATSDAQKFINTAMQYIGSSYVYGAAGPRSFDCSGLVQYSYKQAFGVTIPRTSAQQGTNDAWTKITSKDNLRAGDLIFFRSINSSGTGISHVGIYVGNNQMLHSPSSGKKVCIVSLSTAYYNSRFVCGRRLFN